MATKQSVEEVIPSGPAAGLLADLASTFQFLSLGIRQFSRNASFVPSSRSCVNAMVRAAPVAQARTIVEFGPGTGVITRGILKAMAPDARLVVIELDRDLLATTASRLRDPRLIPIHGSAVDAPALLAARGIEGPVDIVFSSVGIAIMSDALRDAIESTATAILSPSGTLVQFHYVHVRWVTYQFGQGWSRFNAIAFHRRYFADVRRTLVLPNIPPCFVYACRQPLSAEGPR
jgi:phospholipid N-methyltransferase